MKTATVYARGKALYFRSVSITTTGLSVGMGPVPKVDVAESASVKGKAVLDVLSMFQQGVPHPTNWANLLAPLLEAAGVKSWNTFAKNAKCVDIVADDTRYTFIPNVNLGPKDGFERVPDNGVVISASVSAEEVGSALQTALDRCQ